MNGRRIYTLGVLVIVQTIHETVLSKAMLSLITISFMGCFPHMQGGDAQGLDHISYSPH